MKFLPHTFQYLEVDSSDCLHDPSPQRPRDLPCVAGT
jgi:hypothetical protein